jgi:hypothetical protein
MLTSDEILVLARARSNWRQDLVDQVIVFIPKLVLGKWGLGVR